MIDDSKMHTLASASTVQKPISEEFDFSSGPTIVSFDSFMFAKIKKKRRKKNKVQRTNSRLADFCFFDCSFAQFINIVPQYIWSEEFSAFADIS